MIRNSRLHRWCHLQGPMYSQKIVVCEVQRKRRFQIGQLLTERIRESGEAPYGHAHRQVLPLDIRLRQSKRIMVSR
jgi:hypothetical protein